MGFLHLIYLEAEKIYGCITCKSPLSEFNEMVSNSFQGRNGKAYLFSKVVNITKGPLEDRTLMTGLHTVCDIYCIDCQSYVGWKYERAYDPLQKYKEGKYILERKNIKKLGWT